MPPLSDLTVGGSATGRGKKRAAVQQKLRKNGASASTALSIDSPVASSSSSSSSSSRSDDASKRLKRMASSISKNLLCAITQELMVDPVLAEDGHTYERTAIEKWLAKRSTSPLDPSCRLDASRLMTNRAVKTQIEELVESGELDGELCTSYHHRKGLLSPEHAQELFDEGKVEEAAKLGHAEAQGEMAERCYFGTHGVRENRKKSAGWAKKAAEGGDKVGQFRLGHAYQMEGNSYGKYEDSSSYALALKWYEKAAEQGCPASMNNIGGLYLHGGHGVAKHMAKALNWFHKAAEPGFHGGQHSLGECYYYGWGVTQNQRTARSWFQKAADQGNAGSMCTLGYMMVKGRGGERDVKEGIAWWEEAAVMDDGDGDDEGSGAGARENLSKLYRFLDVTAFTKRA